MSKAVSGYAYWTSQAWRQLLESFPASYTCWLDGTTYRAECNVAGLLDYSGLDATTVIQAAATTLSTTGGRIHLKPAIYSMATALNFSAGPIIFTGEGAGTVLRNSGSTYALGSMVRFTGNYRCLIADMKIDNNSVGDTNHGVAAEAGGVVADNLWVTNTTGTGILALVDATNLDYFIVKNCRVDNPGNNGTHVGPGIRVDHAVGSSETIDHVVLADNSIVNGEEHGIKVYDSSVKSCVVKNNYVYNAYTNGINALATKSKIIGNYVDTTTTAHGISVSGSHSKIIQNTVNNTFGHGILVETGTDFQVKDNDLSNIGSGAAYSGISSTGTGLSAIGNHVDTCAGSGIMVGAGDARVIGNKITGSTTRDVYLNNATYSLVTDNRMDCAIAVGEYGTSDNNLIIDNVWTGITNFLYGASGAGPSLDTVVKNNVGYNPKGKVATPFKDASTSISIIKGDAAAPTASTDYIVKNSDTVISSTDSGNVDCAIQIDDPDGNPIFPAAQSTLVMKTVPVGYIVNWGAFTGAAPTVVVCFA